MRSPSPDSQYLAQLSSSRGRAESWGRRSSAGAGRDAALREWVRRGAQSPARWPDLRDIRAVEDRRVHGHWKGHRRRGATSPGPSICEDYEGAAVIPAPNPDALASAVRRRSGEPACVAYRGGGGAPLGLTSSPRSAGTRAGGGGRTMDEAPHVGPGSKGRGSAFAARIGGAATSGEKYGPP